LEYGEATIEVHEDAIEPGWKVLVHDDLLATGGTAEAAAKLCEQVGARVAGFSFLVDLSFLQGKEVLKKDFPQAKICGLATY
ncbi:MAG: adenine phosphoribosyltransferase, partial [Bacteroidota bacterium]|nr:adenine phosphoribosyltransferase [Bacteroidota bacterium]MDX5431558.1 adenine phosphoribosyltransferase [Bacteroidota bacterium]MDX5470279.1 adenine phosphoribosyltransferase [Bacteroidota bacterium]